MIDTTVVTVRYQGRTIGTITPLLPWHQRDDRIDCYWAATPHHIGTICSGVASAREYLIAQHNKYGV